MKIEIVLGDDMVEKAIEAIRRAAQTGRIGDGKIFVSNIEEAIRIRRGSPDWTPSEPRVARDFDGLPSAPRPATRKVRIP